MSSGISAGIHGSQGTGEDPLFRFQDCHFLARKRLVAKLRVVLQEVGLHPEKIHRAYLPHWYGHNGSSLWSPRFSDKNNGKMGECSIPAICVDSSGAACSSVL